MSKKNVADLEPGMICAETVKGRGSMVLVHAGMELSEQIISYLQQWGLDEIEIFDGKIGETNNDTDFDGQDGAQIDSAVFEEAARQFFKHTDIEHPAMEVLFGEYLTRLVMNQVAKSGEE